MLCAANNHG
ncbi:hypothetical protein YPPY76_2603, partial [Yersinia pestis PY-76]